MHNTLTEYKQIHNKTISWNDNWILIFICFVGRLLLSTSSSSSIITISFLIQMIKMDKRFFDNWVLHIPHRLSYLLWTMKSWSSVAPIFFSLIISWTYSSSKNNHFLLEHIPWMNESHDPGRPFKVSITTPAFFTSSFTASICSLIWETLVK